MTNTIDRNLIQNLIYDSIDEVNEHFLGKDWLEKSPDTPLLGLGSRLDSLGFVNLVAAIEERCEATFALPVSLTGDPGQSENGPFRSVSSLTDYVQRLLESSGTL